MDSPSVPVSIVIPAYNAAGTIAETLAAVLGQQGFAQLVEVIVVDDGSTDPTAEIVRQFPVRYLYQPNAGPASARNRGFRCARGPYVLFTDSDCVPDSRWAMQLVEALHHPVVGAVGGSYTLANRGRVAEGIHWEIVVRHRRFRPYVRALGSYNLGVRREVMEQVGGFDETYPAASGEDNDLSYRILAAGYKLRWVPAATVGHHHTAKLGKYLREQQRHGYFRTKLYRRHAGRMSGDDYTTPKDVLEPVLVCALAASLPLCWLPRVWLLGAGALAVLAAIQVPMTVRMVLGSGRLSVAAHAGVMFLRAFWRTWGFLQGLPSMLRRPAPAL
jgi:glycosyltransferase involved in cell wall biosynthesis